MIELFGLQLGTIFQGGMLLTMLSAWGVWWIKGMPDRSRAANEAKVSHAAELADRFRDWRKEVHDLKVSHMIFEEKQKECEKARQAAETLNEQLMFLIELMIAELEILDPKSKTVIRARTMFKRISTLTTDPKKSDALNTAEMAVQDAKQTLISTTETREEVKAVEAKEGGK